MMMCPTLCTLVFLRHLNDPPRTVAEPALPRLPHVRPPAPSRPSGGHGVRWQRRGREQAPAGGQNRERVRDRGRFARAPDRFPGVGSVPPGPRHDARARRGGHDADAGIRAPDPQHCGAAPPRPTNPHVQCHLAPGMPCLPPSPCLCSAAACIL